MSVKRAMVLAVRTLAQPTDVLAMGPRKICRAGDGDRTLRFQRGKISVWVEVAIVGNLSQAIAVEIWQDAALAFVPCAEGEYLRFGKTPTFGDDLERILEFDTARLHPQWNGVKCVYCVLR